MWNARITIRPAYSPAAPALGCKEKESNPVIVHKRSPKSLNISLKENRRHSIQDPSLVTKKFQWVKQTQSFISIVTSVQIQHRYGKLVQQTEKKGKEEEEDSRIQITFSSIVES